MFESGTDFFHVKYIVLFFWRVELYAFFFCFNLFANYVYFGDVGFLIRARIGLRRGEAIEA